MTFQFFTCLYSCFICFICILIHLFEHFNVIAIFKLNIIIVYTISIIGIICAQFVNNCLQSYNAFAYVVIQCAIQIVYVGPNKSDLLRAREYEFSDGQSSSSVMPGLEICPS